MNRNRFLLLATVAMAALAGGLIWIQKRAAESDVAALTADVEHREMTHDEVLEAKASGDLKEMLEASRQEQDLSLENYLELAVSPDAKVRIDAIKHLAEFDAPEAIAALRQAAENDEDSFVRRIAARKLEALEAVAEPAPDAGENR